MGGSRPGSASVVRGSAIGGCDDVRSDPRAVAAICADRLPNRVLRELRRFRHGPGAFVRWISLSARVFPWTNPDARRSGTVHLGGDFAEVAATERTIQQQGRMPERPFVLVGSSTWPIPGRSVGTCTRYGPTPMSPTVTGATPPRRSSVRSNVSRRASRPHRRQGSLLHNRDAQLQQ